MDRQKQIEKIENELVSKKPWYEKGEVSVKERPKNSLLFDEDCDSDEFVRNIEFIRNKTTLKIENTVDVLIERIVKDRIKRKEYDNPRKTVQKKKETVIEVADKEEKTVVHDILDGRRSENDKFMEPSEMIRLFNEIDSALVEISDKSYTGSRPMQTTSK
ncbi:hypothetical protein NEPAR06_0358 [Nematocida parisii]|uniref:Uncharacterized protein n=1 Tax=Nematocida parisii (strain ERTm3) TaxID=935791 RepID=I3EG88_NEMP3|nr:uncharacterized protein NEPG_01271 [Nematocida parisii ERTm1]EIJ88235.1 hypothetical protein NEQG_01679 [Nematocida parisii ERTm3]KAI5142345.1 hypothetical protein NEPAR07_0087 [Nematocida parisii]EIJ93699.1 hypothetical protein NEPG_01271 [Nematocida parisii ERTm1]KAI5153322.1 hypothetical protein NEPAR06_0358 [Nematocida parisii]KAI5155702.1 hypothetical protein NEPAR05_0073 [Nematocida parisii]|eukprot:XP_013059099.1 hypothetical protein NEPG_01271 [Nematocida parisii ERTm1]